MKLNITDVLSRVEKVDKYKYRIKKFGPMKVDGVFYATPEMLPHIKADEALLQLANVATMPGIVKYSIAMPDIHWGYGFPIGGVAAFDYESGVISPGGVGYDINCGVRLLVSNLNYKDVKDKIITLVNGIFQNVPCGVGSKRKDFKLKRKELLKVLEKGARWVVERGMGDEEDLKYIEDGGEIKFSNPDVVSERAIERGLPQLGTLGSGNHFIEVGYVEKIYNEKIAEVMGLFEDQLTVTIHTGSRGLGYQVCDDYIKVMRKVVKREGFDLPDMQLCCAPLTSKEGKNYLGAMGAAANYAFANREIITHWVRETFYSLLNLNPNSLGLKLIYDVAHNIAKIEEHIVDGEKMKVCVHRKGATRALGKGSGLLPEKYREFGQPVLIPGDMGRYSYVLVGTEKAMEDTFGSACHGAGRMLSRAKAKKRGNAASVRKELEKSGIYLIAASKATIVEEMPEAYKDVSDVIKAVSGSGIGKKVARLRPLGVVKG